MPIDNPDTQPRMGFVAKFARASLFILMLWMVVQMVVDSERGFAQGPSQGLHAESLRTNDTPTSAALLVDNMAGVNLADGWIDFPILKKTVLRDRPPPEYVPQLAEMDGDQVKMVAFMTPYDSLKDMRRFMAMPMPTGCYFCAPPSPKEVVFIRQDTDKQMPFINEPLLIEGTLDLWKEDSSDDAHQMFLYVINDAKVRGLSQKAVKELAAERRKQQIGSE